MNWPTAIPPEGWTEKSRPLALAVFALGLLLLVGASLSWGTTPSLMALSIGSALCAASLILLGVISGAKWHHNTQSAALSQVLNDLPDACFLTDSTGLRTQWQNQAATSLLQSEGAANLRAILSDFCASPTDLTADLVAQAQATGHGKHDIALPHERWTFHVTPAGKTRCLWRIQRQQQTDGRDDLPFDFVLADAMGDITYISPALRPLWPSPPTRLAALMGGKTAKAGTVLHLSAGEKGQTLAVTPFHGPDNQTGLLILPKGPTPLEADAIESARTEIRNLPVAICHIDKSGRIVFANDEAQRVLRLHPREAPAISTLLEGLGRPIDEWLGDIRAGRLVQATEVLRLTRAEEEAFLKVSLTGPRQSPCGYIVAVLSDVTEYKSLEAKFTQSQKMQAIGQLAGGVAHDFNNLLTAISGHCDLILLRRDRSDVDYPDLMQIQQNTNRAAALIRQLLALSRQQALTFETFAVHECLADVTHLLNRLIGEKITLSLSLGDDVRPIRSDKRQFEQVLMNLVINARDAMPMGGEICIITEACTLANPLQRDQATVPVGDYTVIRVRDQGTGIPEALKDKVFDPFVTTKRQGEGTGLGLSTVYGIIKQSGGYVFIDSQEGAGTTLTLYFAAQTAEEQPKAKPVVERNPVQTMPARTILLVEDEAPVRSFAARALRIKGHTVLEADSAEAALDLLKDPDLRPDLFVSDVIMPGLDGPSWVAQVRARFPDTPVVFISGYAEDSRIAAQARIGNAVFLGKPFTLAQFTSVVFDQLRGADKAA